MLHVLKTPKPKAAVKKTGYSLSGDQSWLFANGETASGSVIDDYSGLTLSAVFCAIDKVSDAFKSLPWGVFQRNGDSREPRQEHAADRLLRLRPNPETTPSRFKKTMCERAIWYQAAYAWIEGNAGKPEALWPIHPTRVLREKAGDGESVVYRVYDDDGRYRSLTDNEVLAVVGFTYQGLQPIPLYILAAESLGMTKAAEDYGARFFRNDARPSLVLEHPEGLSESALENLKQSWNTLYGHGGSNRQGVAILEGGMKLNTYGVPNEQAQFLETRTFQIAEVSRWTKVPPHKLGDLERATYSNIESQAIEYVGEAIMPWAIEFEQEAAKKLLTTEQHMEQGYYTKLQVNGLLRGDSQARSTYYREMFNIGVFTINDIRRMEDMNGIGPDGDKHYRPLNMEPVDAPQDHLGEPPVVAQVARADDAIRIFSPMFRSTVDRMAGVRKTAAGRKSFVAEKFDADFALKLRKELAAPVESLAAWIVAQSGADADGKSWLEFVCEETKRFAEYFVGVIRDGVLPVNVATEECIGSLFSDMKRFLKGAENA